MEFFQPWHLVILLCLFGPLYVLPLWLIARKAGLHAWVTLIAFIPPLGFLVLFYIALSDWKRSA
jgi:hypothetical protein